MTNRSSFVDVHPHQLDYRLLVEECLAGIYLIQNERFLYVNPALANLFGYTPEEIVGELKVGDLVAPADRARVLANLRARADGRVSVIQYGFRGLRQDGTTFDVEVRGRRTEALGEAAILGTLLDTSDRAAERDRLRFLARAAELLDSSLDYETTLESLARLMIPFFADLCFIDIIEGEEVRCLAAGPWPGEGIGFSVHAAGVGGGGRDLARDLALLQGTGHLFETVPRDVAERIAARLPNRQPADLRITSLIVVPLAARGQIIGAMTLASTVSGRRYRHEDLEFCREVARSAALAVDNARLYREAQEAIRKRQEVLAVVSHDLRNPLNIIVMSVGLALEQDRRRQGPLEVVHNAAKEMERLINDLLDLSAIQAGGFSVSPSAQPIEPLIVKCIEMLSPAALNRSIEVQNCVPAGETLAMIDPGRVTQALCNLLGNAIKFTPEGGTVEVGMHLSDRFATISVHDSGPGIPDAELPHVFEKYWQLDRADGRGAGLGLAIVRGIAEAHGGSVAVKSSLGEGTTFLLNLPLAPIASGTPAA